ncbi:MAG: hypothetical protein ABS36_12645 [Acidobacteria bacterium SCN 69-37]|nr:MAG: hypothetical protein ABS36_12645 [Acidobacteria bacterium SCN 69-37]
MILAVEDAFPLPHSVVESLTAMGLDVVRTNSAARAAAVARSILLDGVVLTSEDSVGDDDAIRPAIALLFQGPPVLTCPVVVLTDHDLTTAEARCVSGLDVLLLRPNTLDRRDARERLVRHVADAAQ